MKGFVDRRQETHCEFPCEEFWSSAWLGSLNTAVQSNSKYTSEPGLQLGEGVVVRAQDLQTGANSASRKRWWMWITFPGLLLQAGTSRPEGLCSQESNCVSMHGVGDKVQYEFLQHLGIQIH